MGWDEYDKFSYPSHLAPVNFFFNFKFFYKKNTFKIFNYIK